MRKLIAIAFLFSVGHTYSAFEQSTNPVLGERAHEMFGGEMCEIEQHLKQLQLNFGVGTSSDPTAVSN
jgi:hypothetical protein